MPFPKTWIEELIIEWLQLEGFLAQSNLPVGVPRAGGRLEADVVGARIYQGNLQIRHIETGQLARGKESINSVQQKFSENVEISVTNYFKKIFEISGGTVDYLKMYVATYWTKPVVNGLVERGITVENVPQFIRERVFPTIEAWRQNPPHQPRGRSQTVTLPESNWLLQMLDHLAKQGLIEP